MKKLYFLILFLFFSNIFNAQNVNIPDLRFKNMLLRTPGIINNTAIIRDLDGNIIKIDANNDGEIQESEALQISYIDVHGDGANGFIMSLEGISKFTNLKTLICSKHKISSLNLATLRKLETLICNNNNLTSLNISSQTELTTLNCSYNYINLLDLSSSIKLTDVNCGTNSSLYNLNLRGLVNLKTLDCGETKLTSLDVNGLTGLTSVICSESALTALDVSNLVNLEQLDCSYNKLATIKFGVLPKLKKLYCFANQITSFESTGLDNLESLSLNYNKIASLDLSNLLKLEFLGVAGNQLTVLKLNNLSKLVSIQAENNILPAIDIIDCPNLEVLVLYGNKLISLDVNQFKKLTSLSISENSDLINLSLKNGSPDKKLYLDISKCPNLKYICTDDFKLKTTQDLVNQLGYINCNVNSYCSFVPGGDFYTINGVSRYDENTNGCGLDDVLFPNLRLAVSGNIVGEVISNDFGSYSISLAEGNYTVTPKLEKPDYYTVNPAELNITFSKDLTSPLTQELCITANGMHPDLEIVLIPIEAARPGFTAKYKLVYSNKGTMTQSGLIKLIFDDRILEYSSSNPVFTVKSVDNMEWSFTNLKPFERREIIFSLVTNKPTDVPSVNNGDVLKFIASINSQNNDDIPEDNTFTLYQTVLGSLDPNDKICLEGSVITPDLIGKYVHYMIRFENTGTYAAQNIVVKDMIDLSKFDISTLIPTSSSHSFVTKISEGNKVEFIFENINLPFDDAINDGYIAFKIKTNPTLKVGDSFTNDANIYFDYNFPILTNKATSTFKSTLATQDFDFSRYLSLYPNPANQFLNISQNLNIEILSFEIYDVLGQIVLAVPNAKTASNIDISKLRVGNYFIRVKSDKGSSSMKFIKN
ncbi:T9SS type A sorting domain-containing protein [Flavobacterium sp. GN10]|uniref:T9SS type A sorting domain-containing protein n=1 Tax=Flavobacterium tagetis TaxID=2801336 RepID=A0ABS1KFQ8_9FLAO|nr:T9SS type A sorting domain-containing protein [Flavobacterium tagetis]MBL0738032.1 T9SS type A sorting domain-containing protein [Flavobacterium tagetis]